MDGLFQKNSHYFDLVGVTFVLYLGWHGHITTILTNAAKKIGFLFQARK